jgi:hypothetical protein
MWSAVVLGLMVIGLAAFAVWDHQTTKDVAVGPSTVVRTREVTKPLTITPVVQRTIVAAHDTAGVDIPCPEGMTAIGGSVTTVGHDKPLYVVADGLWAPLQDIETGAGMWSVAAFNPGSGNGHIMGVAFCAVANIVPAP